jgi:hypothetical protein
MQTVDRDEFINWIDGVLIKVENGDGVIVHEKVCNAAETALNNGETIGLTMNGRIISTMIKNGDVFEEKEEICKKQ